MSGLAKFLLNLGKKVAGSDVVSGEYVKDLMDLGVKVSDGRLCESIKDYDVIIFTDAIKNDNGQLIEAKRLKKEILSRGQLLYEVSRSFKKVIAVSGCHGKTTCTAMLAHIFSAAGKRFGAHIGGKDKTFSNSYYCGNDYFLTEACEYKRNFLLLKPNVSVILNADADHLECYGSADNLRLAYIGFAEVASVSVTLYGELGVAGGVTFGFDKRADYSARRVKETCGKYSFCAYEGERFLGEVNLSVYGKHNVLNALAAIAAARTAAIPFLSIKEGLENYSGVERRFERIGAVNGAECIADYAHHPNEISATIQTAKSIARGKLYVIFQPHTYSRTKNLFKEFVKALSTPNNLLIYRTFAAREYFDNEGSALTLSQHVKKSKYGDDIRDIYDFIKFATADDLVLFLGAGDIYEIAKSLLKDMC